MAKPLDPKEVVTAEEMCISSMYETAAIIQVLEEKKMAGFEMVELLINAG